MLLEQALIAAAKAFLNTYASQGSHASVAPLNLVKQPSSAPTPTSNGIPVCSIHGKAMKPASEKQKKYGHAGPLGYKCTAKNDDGTWCEEMA